MKSTDLAKRVKDLRNQLGITQEKLAENSGLSLRTIQRIENGETEPRGDTLERLAKTLNIPSDEIADRTDNRNNGYLTALNLSSLAFMIFPLFGIIIPLIIWVSKKDKINDIHKIGKNVINFQITWTILVLGTYIFFVGRTFIRINQADDISPSIIGNPAIIYAISGFLYLYNLTMVIINTVRINSGKKIRYKPSIRFIR